MLVRAKKDVRKRDKARPAGGDLIEVRDLVSNAKVERHFCYEVNEPTGRNDWTKAIIGQFARNWG